MNHTRTRTTFSFVRRFGVWWQHSREARQRLALRRCCPPATVAAEQIPPEVRAAWAHHAPDEFPGLAVDDGAWLRCSLGLAQFFEACRLQKEQGPCALPSKAADSVWHVWLELDPAGLASWQQRFFGRAVEHRENAELGAPLEEALARTWTGACRSEGLELLGPKLPLLFALDGRLRLPTGWAYGYQQGALAHRQIDGFGKPGSDVIVHAAIGGASLVALGLMTQSELTTAVRRRQSSDSGSSWSFDSGSSDACSDAGGSSDSGSSCGSSCGGGGD